MARTLVIAEAACTWHIGCSSRNHLANMIKCIRIAKSCDADICKFQWTSQPAEMARRRHIENVGTYHRLAWPAKWFPILAAECESEGIEFGCTVYLPIDIAIIAPFVKRFKVASLEATDVTFIYKHLTYKKPLLISTGAMTWDEVEELRDRAWGDAEPEPWWWKCHDVQLLQAQCAYPAPLAAAQLIQIRRYGADGFSDHTGDILAGALAVACGAKTIEVHFRLYETRPDNPDFAHSHDPASLKQYIKNIRRAEIMLGDGLKKVEECERPMLAHRVTA